jgi:SSS family transporter
MKESLFCIVVCLVSICGSHALCADNTPASADGDVTRWDRLPDLPYSRGLTRSFVGVHDNMLIIAGGTSLHEHNGRTERVWHDDIWILAKNSEGTYTWIDNFRLDKPRANGAAVSTDQGVVCIGGNDASQTFADGVILSWNRDTQKLNIETLPNLPRPCTNTSATLISSELTNTIYVAGGQSGLDPVTTMHNFWALDLPQKTGDFSSLQWRNVLPWPGPSRASNLTISQHNGKADCIYVISGQGSLLNHPGHGQTQPLNDVYEFNPQFYDAQRYNPETGAYTGDGLRAHPWRKRADLPHSVVAGTGIDVGQSHIFIFGGDDAAKSRADNPSTNTDSTTAPNELLMYHTITNTWISKDALPGNFMKTNLVKWDDSIVAAAGETKKGVPTASIWKVTPVERSRFFGVVNFIVIGFYLAALIGVGVFFAFRQKNTNDFFRGGQRIPWFVAGCSIFATMLSSLTFIAIPAKAFMTDWTFIVINIGIVVITPFVVAYVLPFFRHIDATSAYEYLEKRFNVTARLFGSASFILFQIGRMAVVMFLTALPLAAITPLSVIQCILIMGIISIVYCTMGGLEAVVWTDTIQTFVLMGGAFLSYIIIIRSLDGGFADFISAAASNGKFNMVNWDFSASSYTTAAIWVVILGGIGQNLVPYISDMAVVQRYMSVSDEKRAAKGIWTNAIMVIPATLIFFGLGAALFVFYQAHPDKLDPTLQNDAIFPLFIARELPIGIAGLVVAGVFSAAQSTLSTSMNSTSTAFVTDFVRRFNRRLSERTYLQMARMTTVLFGALGTLVAILLVLSDIKSLWDVFMAILGLLGSSMCGLFMLGMYTRRANGMGAVTGAITGAVGLYLVKTYTSMHFLLYTIVGIGFCFVVGYLVSFLVGGKEKQIEGLTVYTLNKDPLKRTAM